MAATFQFNPDRVAYFEADRLAGLLRPPMAEAAAAARGALPGAVPHPLPAARCRPRTTSRGPRWPGCPWTTTRARSSAYYEKFYRMARRYSGLRFDPARVAALELRYNDDHRRLVARPTRRPSSRRWPNCTARPSASRRSRRASSRELRVLANNTVDLITGKTSTDVEGDWRAARTTCASATAPSSARSPRAAGAGSGAGAGRAAIVPRRARSSSSRRLTRSAPRRATQWVASSIIISRARRRTRRCSRGPWRRTSAWIARAPDISVGTWTRSRRAGAAWRGSGRDTS